MKKSIAKFSLLGLLVASGTIFAQTPEPKKIEAWVTNPDRSSLFEKQAEPILFGNRGGRGGATIIVDDLQAMQSIDGFGFALTGGSAELGSEFITTGSLPEFN